MNIPVLFERSDPRERAYFLRIGEGHPQELALHEGLWIPDASGNDWRNVTEHCLFVAARVRAFGRFLRLPEESADHLVSAAVLHDFNKREEMQRTKADIALGGSGRGGYLETEKLNESILRERGFGEEVIELTSCAAGDPECVYPLAELIHARELVPDELAKLVIYYVDNYTRGSAWVEAVEYFHGRFVNDVDRRRTANEQNPAYQAMNEEGRTLNAEHPFFRKMTRFQAAARLAHLIEKRLYSLRPYSATVWSALDLPEYIDELIKWEIKNAA